MNGCVCAYICACWSKQNSNLRNYRKSISKISTATSCRPWLFSLRVVTFSNRSSLFCCHQHYEKCMPLCLSDDDDLSSYSTGRLILLSLRGQYVRSRNIMLVMISSWWVYFEFSYLWDTFLYYTTCTMQRTHFNFASLLVTLILLPLPINCLSVGLSDVSSSYRISIEIVNTLSKSWQVLGSLSKSLNLRRTNIGW